MHKLIYKPGTILRVKNCVNFFSMPHWKDYCCPNKSYKYCKLIPGNLLMFVDKIESINFNISSKFIVVFLHREKLIWDGMNNNHIEQLMGQLDIIG